MIPVAWWGSGWGTWIRNQFRQHPNFSMAARETTVRNCSTLLEPVKLPRRHRSTRRRVRVNDHGIWSTLRRKSGFQPASFRRVLTPPLDLWLRTRSRAKRRRTAMFLAPWPCRYRERSSLKVTSRSQCMRRVAPGNRTPRLSQNRTGHSRVIRLPSSKPSYGPLLPMYEQARLLLCQLFEKEAGPRLAPLEPPILPHRPGNQREPHRVCRRLVSLSHAAMARVSRLA